MKETKIEKLILDLSNRWDCSPQEAVDRLNSMNESEINKLINSMTKKFKNGGFIECLRNGNKIADCKCGDKIGVKKAEKGLSTIENPQLPKYAKIIEGGGKYNDPRRVYYAHNRADLSRMPHNPKDGDIFSEELSVDPTVYWVNEIGKAAQPFGMNYPVRPTVYSEPYYLRYIQHDNSGLNVQKADEIDPDKAKVETSNKIKTIRNQQNGGVVKAENGISMRQVRQAIRDNGLQGHNAYANMKNALRAQGYRGREMRQAARRNIVESAYPRAVEETPSIEVLPTGPQINMPSSTLVARDPGIAPVTRSSRPDVLTFSGQSFGEAFNNARKMGLSEFAWQGGEYDRYHTGLEGDPTPTIGETFNGKTTGGSVAPMASTDWFYNAGARAKEWVKENQPIRSAWRALWDPHPEPLNTYDRKGAAQQMVRDYLNENSPRAKARLEK